MRKKILYIITALIVLAASPAAAQNNWGQNNQWYQDQYSSQENDRGKTERVLCDIERGARIIGNIANAIQDRGGFNHNSFGGYNDCQNYRQEYRDNYRQRDSYYRRYDATQNHYQYIQGGQNLFNFPNTFGQNNQYQNRQQFGFCVTAQGQLVTC